MVNNILYFSNITLLDNVPAKKKKMKSVFKAANEQTNLVMTKYFLKFLCISKYMNYHYHTLIFSDYYPHIDIFLLTLKSRIQNKR